MSIQIDDLTPGVHAFNQGVDGLGNHTFGIVVIPDDETAPPETFEFAGRPGMSEAQAAAEFEAHRFPEPLTGEELAAIAAADRRKAASSECRRRIYKEASAETQMNMFGASAVISSKTASARSDEEKAVLVGVEAALGWVESMRGNIAPLVADPAKDITADESWPVIPPAAVAITEKF